MFVSRSGLGWLAGVGLVLLGGLVAGDAAAEKVGPERPLSRRGALASPLTDTLTAIQSREPPRARTTAPTPTHAPARTALAGDGSPKKQRPKKQPSKKDRASNNKGRVRYVVAAMGDSLTDPRSHGGRYLEYLRDKCPESRFDSYGVGGNMVNQMRRRFVRDVYGEHTNTGKPARRADKRPHYTHVLVLGGINDICSDESANRTNRKITADLTKMYDMAHQHGAKVIAMTMPPWAGFTRYYNRRRANSTFEVNDWIRQQHSSGKVDGLVDVYPIMSCGKPEFLCERWGWRDKVHWNKAGHQVVGKALHQQIFADCK